MIKSGLICAKVIKFWRKEKSGKVFNKRTKTKKDFAALETTATQRDVEKNLRKYSFFKFKFQIQFGTFYLFCTA